MNRNTRPPNQTRKPNAPLPSGGGRGDGYDQHTREFAIDAEQDGISNSAFFEDQRQQGRYPCRKSVKRWQDLRQQYGHVRACRRTGNARATVLRDHNIILLALYRLAFPKATYALKKKLSELLNGRLAMCAVGGIATQTVLTGHGFPYI
jgi:hypothetical protein